MLVGNPSNHRIVTTEFFQLDFIPRLAFGSTYFSFGKSRQNHFHQQNLLSVCTYPIFCKNNISLILVRLLMTLTRIKSKN